MDLYFGQLCYTFTKNSITWASPAFRALSSGGQSDASRAAAKSAPTSQGASAAAAAARTSSIEHEGAARVFRAAEAVCVGAPPPSVAGDGCLGRGLGATGAGLKAPSASEYAPMR